MNCDICNCSDSTVTVICNMGKRYTSLSVDHGVDYEGHWMPCRKCNGTGHVKLKGNGLLT